MADTRLQVPPGVLAELGERIAHGLGLLHERTLRIRRIVRPRGEQLREYLEAIGGRLRQRHEPAVSRCDLLEPLALVHAEMDQTLMETLLENGPLLLAGLPESGRELVLTLQRPMCRRPLNGEELVSQISQPVPVSRTHELAPLQANTNRRRHPDARLDRLAVELLQRSVIALAEEAEKEIDNEGLQAVGIA